MPYDNLFFACYVVFPAGDWLWPHPQTPQHVGRVTLSPSNLARRFLALIKQLQYGWWLKAVEKGLLANDTPKNRTPVHSKFCAFASSLFSSYSPLWYLWEVMKSAVSFNSRMRISIQFLKAHGTVIRQEKTQRTHTNLKQKISFQLQ